MDRNVVDANTLLNIGFRDIGEWFKPVGKDGLDYRLDGPNELGNLPLMDSRSALYAFVQDSDVQYIGKTARTIRKRFVGYKKPASGQHTNLRCNAKIAEQLRNGSAVRIYVFNADPQIANLYYAGFAIDLAAALEDSLIDKFSPPWNGGEKKKITETAEHERADAGDPLVVQDEVPLSVPEMDPSAVGIASFQIRLGATYYNQGLINPGVDASRHLGEHDDAITVYLGTTDNPLISRIDRKANANGNVRLVGGNRAVANWFQANFSQGENVEARVLDRNSILLLLKL